MDILEESFPNKVISKNGTISWLARSLDLSAPDYFLWSYLKLKVFTIKSRTRNPERELKIIIRNEINAISLFIILCKFYAFGRRMH